MTLSCLVFLIQGIRRRRREKTRLCGWHLWYSEIVTEWDLLFSLFLRAVRLGLTTIHCLQATTHWWRRKDVHYLVTRITDGTVWLQYKHGGCWLVHWRWWNFLLRYKILVPIWRGIFWYSVVPKKFGALNIKVQFPVLACPILWRRIITVLCI